mgnify:CR=1 FL=1
MRIVVEGYDASGKSTLAQALANKLGLGVHEAGPKPKDDDHAISQSLNQLSLDNKVLCRITPISRQAYQLDRSLSHYVELQNLVKKLVNDHTIFIFCTGEADNHVVKDHDTLEHLEYLDEYGETIKQRYEDIFQSIDHYKYDFKIDDMEKFVCKIQQRFLKLTEKYGSKES